MKYIPILTLSLIFACYAEIGATGPVAFPKGESTKIEVRCSYSVVVKFLDSDGKETSDIIASGLNGNELTSSGSFYIKCSEKCEPGTYYVSLEASQGTAKRSNAGIVERITVTITVKEPIKKEPKKYLSKL